MASLGKTLRDLDRGRRRFQSPDGDGPEPAARTGRLAAVEAFGANPGGLRLVEYVPARRAERPAVVVVLHGCRQSAAIYDQGSRWSELADAGGFVVLYPEQVSANNRRLCFSWFKPTDTRRGAGEAESIRQMIVSAVERHQADDRRVYIAGLSAGGAMTATLMALHPELFAGGAVIAGLPFGAATSVSQAFSAMMDGVDPADDWGGRVRAVSGDRTAWPVVDIWHGTDDRTVHPSNADALVAQWLDLHGLSNTPPAEEQRHGRMVRRTWAADGRARVRDHRIESLGHGTPASFTGPFAAEPAPFFLDAGVSATVAAAHVWGLLPVEDPPTATADAPPPATLADLPPARVRRPAQRGAGRARAVPQAGMSSESAVAGGSDPSAGHGPEVVTTGEGWTAPPSGSSALDAARPADRPDEAGAAEPVETTGAVLVDPEPVTASTEAAVESGPTPADGLAEGPEPPPSGPAPAARPVGDVAPDLPRLVRRWAIAVVRRLRRR